MSLFAALAEAGRTKVGVTLGLAVALGVIAVAAALRDLFSDRTASAVTIALIGLGLAVGLLVAGAAWGLAEYTR